VALTLAVGIDHPGLEKDVFFKVKRTRNVDFFDFGYRLLFFSYKFCAQTMRLLFLNYNFIFNLHEFTLPLESAAEFCFTNQSINHFIRHLLFGTQ